ncbi:PTS sugar transporter subunit IIA [Humidisolicoccus flavus]|uniref:PTS sugar transporter subunit IIA n=1 Tax=Humidisolicoccus flavus TaxID=3111414 RepID=UPI0032496238
MTQLDERNTTLAKGVAATTWQEAVTAAGRDLVHAGAVGPSYIDEMIQVIDDRGPYCVFVPGIAVPHASPSAIVRKDALAIVVLDEPVSFGHAHYDPVHVIIAAASTSNAQHLRVLSSLGGVLDQPGLVGALSAANSAEEASALLWGAPSTKEYS